MKKILLVIVTLVSVVAVQAQEKLTDKHITINPQKPAKGGIDSGWVIMFGHLMSPPFQVEYRGEKIFINNIQAYPSPLSEEQVGKPMELRAKKQQAFLDDMRKNPKKYEPMRKLRIWIRKQCPFNTKTNEEREQILLHILAQKEWVDKASWDETNSYLAILWHGQAGDSYIRCNKPPKIQYDRPAIPIAEQQAQAVRAKRERLEDIKKTLAEGGCVAFTTDTGTVNFTIPSELYEIMADNRITLTERQKRLGPVVSPGIAEDIVTNYVPEEWKTFGPNK